MSAAVSRLFLVDALKVLAAQIIVLHHLVLYHPAGDRLRTFAAAPFDVLEDYGRWAVQVFLVIGGFLAARALAPRMRWQSSLGLTRTIVRRYLRLVVPLAVILVAAIAAAALARATMTDPDIPGRPGFGQVLAHLLLLQDLLGVEALSAGIWYVAIDFQLFVFMAALLWATRRTPLLAFWLTILVAALALFDFNRDATLDAHGLYFFGSYALGVLAYWGAPRQRRWLFALLVGITLLALAIDFRERLVVALVVAGLLWSATFSLAAHRRPTPRVIGWLSDVSYAQFLVHYPLLLLTNIAAARLLPDTTGAQVAGVLLAWALTIVVAAAFHHGIERPVMTRLTRSTTQLALASR